MPRSAKDTCGGPATLGSQKSPVSSTAHHVGPGEGHAPQTPKRIGDLDPSSTSTYAVPGRTVASAGEGPAAAARSGRRSAPVVGARGRAGRRSGGLVLLDLGVVAGLVGGRAPGRTPRRWVRAWGVGMAADYPTGAASNRAAAAGFPADTRVYPPAWPLTTSPPRTWSAALEALQIRRRAGLRCGKRLAPDEPAIGMRIRDLFATAGDHTDLPLAEVDRAARPPGLRAAHGGHVHPRLQGPPTARRRRPPRAATTSTSAATTASPRGTWSTARAPRVVGRLPRRPLDSPRCTTWRRRPTRCAAAPPSRRPLLVRPLRPRPGQHGRASPSRRVLAADPEPVVHNAVGIFLKHAGERDRAALHRFLDEHARVDAPTRAPPRHREAELRRTGLATAVEGSGPTDPHPPDSAGRAESRGDAGPGRGSDCPTRRWRP